MKKLSKGQKKRRKRREINRIAARMEELLVRPASTPFTLNQLIGMSQFMSRKSLQDRITAFDEEIRDAVKKVMVDTCRS